MLEDIERVIAPEIENAMTLIHVARVRMDGEDGVGITFHCPFVECEEGEHAIFVRRQTAWVFADLLIAAKHLIDVIINEIELQHSDKEAALVEIRNIRELIQEEG